MNRYNRFSIIVLGAFAAALLLRPLQVRAQTPAVTPSQTVPSVKQALVLLDHPEDYIALLNERDYPQAVFQTLDRRNQGKPQSEHISLFSLREQRAVHLDEFTTRVRFPAGFTVEDMFDRMQHGLDFAVLTTQGRRGSFYLKFSSWDGSAMASFFQTPGSQTFVPGTILQPRHRLDLGVRDTVLAGATAANAIDHPLGTLLSLALPTTRSSISGAARFAGSEVDEFDVIVADVRRTTDGNHGWVRYATLFNPQDKRLLTGNGVDAHVLHGGRIYGFTKNADSTVTLFIRGADQWRSDAQKTGLGSTVGDYFQQQAWLSWLEDADNLIQSLGGTVLSEPQRTYMISVQSVKGTHIAPPSKYSWSSTP